MKKQKDIIIPKKSMLGVAPAIAITVVLISGGKAPEALLFWTGIVVGILIWKGYRK